MIEWWELDGIFGPSSLVRLASVVAWVWVLRQIWRSGKRNELWTQAYLAGTASLVVAWRTIVSLVALNDDLLATSFVRFMIRSVQPTIYIMLAFAVVIALRAAPRR